MLYDTYQVHSDVLAPIRLMAEIFRGVLTQPWPLIANVVVPSLASASSSGPFLVGILDEARGRTLRPQAHC
jgi:hypothetical protein